MDLSAKAEALLRCQQDLAVLCSVKCDIKSARQLAAAALMRSCDICKHPLPCKLASFFYQVSM